jgi:hypothetical protein
VAARLPLTAGSLARAFHDRIRQLGDTSRWIQIARHGREPPGRNGNIEGFDERSDRSSDGNGLSCRGPHCRLRLRTVTGGGAIGLRVWNGSWFFESTAESNVNRRTAGLWRGDLIPSYSPNIGPAARWPSRTVGHATDDTAGAAPG